MGLTHRLERLRTRSRAVTQYQADVARTYLRGVCTDNWRAILLGTPQPVADDAFEEHRLTLEQWCRQRGRPLEEGLRELMDETLRAFSWEQIEAITRKLHEEEPQEDTCREA